jgi:ribonuclease P protein component
VEIFTGMLPKKNRVNKKTIKKIFEEGLFYRSSDLTLKYLKDKKNSESRISIIVPKTVAKSAVTRNSLRRKGYAIIKNYISIKPNITGVFIVGKKSAENLENEIKNIFNKIN